MKRTKEDQEWDSQRAEVQIELADLADEYGHEVVTAACAKWLSDVTHTRERERFSIDGDAEADD